MKNTKKSIILREGRLAVETALAANDTNIEQNKNNESYWKR